MTVPSKKVLSAVLNEVRGKKPKELDSEDVLAILSCGTNFMTVYCMLQTYGRDVNNMHRHNQGVELITPIMDALYNRYIEL